MRVVLDTNVVLSACMKPEGLEAQTVALAVAGRIQAYITAEMEAEYRDVLFRAKFAAFQHVAEVLLEQLLRAAHRVEHTDAVTAALDEDDNRFLECAQAAKADYLITGNLRDYPPQWLATRILNARDFMGLQASQT